MLDSKQKRGSAIGVSLPFRQWLAEPSGALPVASRLSLLRYVSATIAATIGTRTLRAAISVRPARSVTLRIRPARGGRIQS